MPKSAPTSKSSSKPPTWMRHRLGVEFYKGKWRCCHGSAAKVCTECIWKHGYSFGLTDGIKQGLPLSKQERAAMTNIRMEIFDAKKHYSKPMHRRMMLLIDRLLGFV
jgi:hypothetical protein